MNGCNDESLSEQPYNICSSTAFILSYADVAVSISFVLLLQFPRTNVDFHVN